MARGRADLIARLRWWYIWCILKILVLIFLVLNAFHYRNSGFHILITSYQLLVSDEKYLRRVKWQYMVLDEAHAIKNSNRWVGNHFSYAPCICFLNCMFLCFYAVIVQ
jgi:SNF2-related domain